jgi:hypothetical protein
MFAKQELTAMLQMQHQICQRLGIEAGSTAHELKNFADATDVGKLASELEDKLPDYREAAPFVPPASSHKNAGELLRTGFLRRLERASDSSRVGLTFTGMTSPVG